MAQGEIQNHTGDNILTLRHLLALTQGDFIQKYLLDDTGKPLLSVAKLSNIETKGNKDGGRIAAIISEKLSIDPSLFEMEADDFARNIGLFIDKPGREVPQDRASMLQVRRGKYIDTVVEAISDYIVREISVGNLQPGGRLPSDREFSEMLNLPRSSVREALKVLDVMGTIDILPGSGMYLAQDTANIFTLPFSWTFLLSNNSNQEVYQLRMILERETVRMATEKRDTPEFKKIRATVEQEKDMVSRNDFSRQMEFDQAFHMGIAKCAGNEILYNLIGTSRKIISFLNAHGMSTIEQMKAVQEEHYTIFKAMEEGDAEKAERLIVHHLQNSMNRYIGTDYIPFD